MARTVRDAKLETREARKRLPARPAPHWRTLIPGALHLGYRRRRKDAPGNWCYRVYRSLRGADKGSPYRVHLLGVADDFQDADGTRVLSFADAQKLAHDRAARPAKRGRLTVGDTIADYVEYLKAQRKTADEVESTAARHILPALGETRVDELTTDALTNWRDRLATTPALVRTRNGEPQNHKPAPNTEDRKRARRATTNRVLTMLKAALNRAFKRGLVDDDLAWRRVKPFGEVDAARPGFLTVSEAKGLINAADKTSGFRDLVHAGLITGCRYGELCALQVGDFHRGKIAIRKSKSGKPRDVVLNDEGVAFFTQLTAGRANDSPMLPRANGEAWQASQQARPMLEACRRARINPPVGIHQLRHTWASLSVMGGMPLMVIARNLGHSGTSMVEKHYGHLTESYVDEAIRSSAPKFGVVKRRITTRLRA
ncbi:MAG TPA: site-specific integrase [Bauldia sp.]